MFRRFTKKRTIVALSAVAALALAGGAIAYFTSSGSGTGSATVGSASPYTVTVDPPSGGALLPGSGIDTIAYHVKNNSTGNQQVSSITAALTTDGAGGVYDTTSNAYVDGCQASWFTVSNSPGTLPDTLAGGATHDGSATVVLKESGTDQSKCEGLTPQLTVNAS